MHDDDEYEYGIWKRKACTALCLNPYFGKTDLANIFRAMFVSVTPSFVINNFTFTNLASSTV